MKRFYTTMSPDNARHILRQTLDETIAKAKQEVKLDGRKRYVVQIVAIVEEDSKPIKVTYVQSDEE